MAWNYYGPFETYEAAQAALEKCKADHAKKYGEQVLGKQWQICSKSDGFYVRIRTASMTSDCPTGRS